MECKRTNKHRIQGKIWYSNIILLPRHPQQDNTVKLVQGTQTHATITFYCILNFLCLHFSSDSNSKLTNQFDVADECIAQSTYLLQRNICAYTFLYPSIEHSFFTPRFNLSTFLRRPGKTEKSKQKFGISFICRYPFCASFNFSANQKASSRKTFRIELAQQIEKFVINVTNSKKTKYNAFSFFIRKLAKRKGVNRAKERKFSCTGDIT